MELKQTPLAQIHQDSGARMVPFAGYEMPLRYSSVVEEHLNVREKVGVFDVSHMGEFLISGPQALALVQKTTSNDASVLEVGQAQYSCLPNENGGIIDDLLVYRLDHDRYMTVVNASNIEKDWNWLTRNNTMEAKIENISESTALLAVQGPLASQALQPLTSVSLGSINFYRFTIGEFAGIQEVVISATGYTGAGGFELYVPAAHASTVWKAVMEAGESFGIKPIGLGARDTLRLEKGYCLYGNDINDHTTPFEAGLGWITKFTKHFIGSESLQAQKEKGISKKLVGFVMVDRGIPRKDYRILDRLGDPVGVVTSGSQSPCLEKGIGLGYVPKRLAAADNEIFIEIRNKSVKAITKKLPLV
jgi:aminomethyltransferase